MDPLSGVASVIAIVGLAKVVIKNTGRLRASLRAPAEIDTLVNEVRALQALLKDIEEAQELLKRSSHHSAIGHYLGQAGLKLRELDDIINNNFMKGPWIGYNRSKHIRIQWLRNQSKVNALQDHLRSINSNLNTCLTATIIPGQARLQTSVQEIALVTNQILQLHAKSVDQHCRPARVEEIHKSLIFSKQEADSSYIGHQLTFGLGDAIEMRKSIESFDQCGGSCQCRCHLRRRIQIADALSSFAGSLCISYIGGQMSRLCDQSSCRKKLPTTLNITYYFPQWLLNKVVCCFMTFDPAGSPKMAMQVPRIRPDTSTIFHLATAGDIEGMKSMFDRGLASPNDVSDAFGYSVLHFAVDIEHVEAIRFLLNQGANPDLTNRLNLTAVDLAWNRILSKRTNSSKIQGLISIFGMSSRADQIESRNLTRLQQIVLGLIDADIDTILGDASLSEIDAKDADGNTVVSWSARCANEHATRTLLGRGADPHPFSRFGSTALHYAAGARSPSCILPLLEAGADANTRNACLEETPLHVAALRHDEPDDYLAPLISHGADVNARDHEGSSVLAFAVQANHRRSAKYLLDRGADINQPDQSGLTPIGIAVIYKQHALLETLLRYGASAEHVTEAGETLLHLCALHGDLYTIDILTRANLTLPGSAIDAQGLRASDHARIRGDEFASAFDELVR